MVVGTLRYFFDPFGLRRFGGKRTGKTFGRDGADVLKQNQVIPTVLFHD